MRYIQGEDRRQDQCLPPRVEDYVSAGAAVRVIDAFVEGLDLRGLGFLSGPKDTGRPAYHPAVLLKLYTYGYLNRIRSSRRLEAECTRNLEVIWLTGNLRPDHWTIAAFRREHKARFKAVLREFNLTCRKLELFGAELVAIDGAKFKAVNSSKRHYTTEELARSIAHIDRQIEEYVEQLDRADEATAQLPGELTAEELAAKIAQLQQRRSEQARVHDDAVAGGQDEVSLTDPDSRGQKKVGVGYNVQIAVDAKHDLIVAEEVVQAANDLAQLHPMASAAQAEMGVTQAVADAGYHEAGQIEKCEQSGVTTYVPAPGTRAGQANGGAEVFPKEQFRYDTQKDCYHCPGAQELHRSGEGLKNGKERIYYMNTRACQECALKRQCTSAAYRKLSRLKNEAVVERQALRVKERPALVLERKTIVEHVFGTLRLWGHDAFLCRGLEMVRAEFSLSALAYNLRRALSVCRTSDLLAALRPAV
jgi:transposase